uniref:F-box domain-containing protein n=1 Tax=Oryzias sinensis TaxID=183150 RepID=A0A8C7ZE21_9TELE
MSNIYYERSRKPRVSSCGFTMAAGRGRFFQSFLEGLKRNPVTEQQMRERNRPGPDESGSVPRGGSRKKTATEQQSFDSENQSFHPYYSFLTGYFSQMKLGSEENFLQRLPLEVLLKILSYLDASSLICVSHVSKLFHRLANDDFVWRNIYASEFGSPEWKPKLAPPPSPATATKEEPCSAGGWKKKFFRRMGEQDMDKWKKDLRSVCPHTSLPQQTEAVLRNLKMSWELALVERSGQETRLDQSRATFFESSVVVCWSCSGVLHVHSICSIHVYGVRKEARRSCRSPRAAWRSLVLRRDTRSDPQTPVGADGLMEVLLLPDVLLGVWRSSSRVAFVMVSLHLHRLVERSLLGSPACPYSEPVDPPSADHSDPEFGLHGYTVHFVLHNANFKIMLGHFRQLSCGSVEKQRRLLELRFISRTDLSEHRLLPGGIRLPWRCGELQGAVENCCFMTLTLLDIHQKPFWCVSAPVTARMSKAESSYYSGEHFLMEYQHADGEVEMKLVWLKEQKQFLVHSLAVCVAVDKVNQHFSREY